MSIRSHAAGILCYWIWLKTKDKSLNKWSRKVIYAYSFSSSWLHMLLKKRSYAYRFLSSSLGIFQELQVLTYFSASLALFHKLWDCARIHLVSSRSPGLLLQKIFLVIPPTRILRRYFQLLAGMVICNMAALSSFFLPRIIKKVIFCHVPVWFQFELAILRLQMALALQLIDLPS